MQHLEQAIQIANDAHQDQADKLGRPFFEHCKRVASAMTSDEARAVAYLHDVVEKSNSWTFDRLKEEGLPPALIKAVDALTHRSGEDYEDFVRRAASNPIARQVKLADLEDNLWQTEQLGADGSKYRRGLEILSGSVLPSGK
ncbi:MAG: metal-dependent phosphohydrolase [Shinella sp.]|nr:metal-dependent phosphohydrolase [Shinella sp.]